MKKIIISGLIAGIIMLIVGMALNYVFEVILFPSLAHEYANVNGFFRPWSDPLMSIYFIYPFIFGVILAWTWNKVKSLFVSPVYWKNGVYFGLSIWFISSIPGMIMTYSSFNVSLTMIFSWLISGLINAIIAGLIFAKMNK